MSLGPGVPEAARRFRVLETLGRGGFGVVYRAEAASHGGFTKQVALKVLRKDVDLSGGVAERLRDEARILGLLRHRAIVRVDGLIELEDGWAVVMEYVPGVNVSSLVRSDCPPRAAVELIAEVASALHAAWHDVNDVTGEPLHLVHRDIKPANIRITSQGEVKVLDFGVARAEFADREAETVSVLFGSMRYMAPERLDGIEGPAGDVYALCIVLAELLSHSRFDEPPKHAGRHEDWERAVQERVKERLPETEGSNALLELLGRGLSYEDEPRPTAGELKQQLRRLGPKIEGEGLAEWAEEAVPELARKVAERRRKQPDGVVDSVLIEQGGTGARAEVTGITHTRALVGGVVAGAGVLVAGVVVVLLLLLGLGWYLWGADDQPLADVEPVQAPAPRPPKLVVEPRARPEPEPEPTAPEPEPEPEPTPAPKPRPATPRPARPTPAPVPAPTSGVTVTLTGDLGTVRLRGATGATLKAGPNQVEPGNYTVLASFDGNDPVEVSHIQVPDASAVLHCSQMLYTCAIR